MGTEPFTAHVHYRRGQTTVVDFATYDAAVRFSKSRADAPNVARVEVTHDHRMVWSHAKGVIPEHQH